MLVKVILEDLSITKKSVLGMYAQLQFSGVSNAVLISNTDFLKAVDINGCQQCTLINRLFM